MKWLAPLVFAMLPMASANAQTINLVCGGKLISYEPTRTESDVPPGATTVDLDRKSITTPVGTFTFQRVSDAEITFGGRTSERAIFGTLDRYTGQMKVFWRTHEEEQKMLARLPHKMSMLSELSCRVGSRLF